MRGLKSGKCGLGYKKQTVKCWLRAAANACCSLGGVEATAW